MLYRAIFLFPNPPAGRSVSQIEDLQWMSCSASKDILQSITGNLTFFFQTKEMAVIWQLKRLLYRIPSHLYSASGAQTVPKVHASAALLAAHLNMTAGSTRERSSSPVTALRPVVRHLTAQSVLHLESACGRASSSAQVLPLFLRTVCISSLFRNLALRNMCAVSGETRRILSVNPTYDWTCFSYALLNVSPMQVESSPPMPCPPPCHSLQNCSLCLGSRGSDGGWQHCVWSMALQQVSATSGALIRLFRVLHAQLMFLFL